MSPRKPRPEEVVALREQMGLTQSAFGDLVYAGLSTVQAWEGGQRRMSALAWEVLCLLRDDPRMARLRKRWQATLANPSSRKGARG